MSVERTVKNIQRYRWLSISILIHNRD